jgi:hypothetical protein
MKHIPRNRYLLLLPLIAVTAATASAATYEWRDANSTGGGNGWQFAGNYDAGGAGNLAFTAADELHFNSTVARPVGLNTNGTIGKLTFGANTATAAISGTTNAATVVNLSGGSRSDAGILLEAGAGNISLNARFNLVGNVTFANNSGVSGSNIELGNSSNGGLQGSGNLLITGGRTVLNKGSASNYANTGTTTINSGGSLQVTGNAVYTTSPITVGSTGTISGTGTLGTTTIDLGGRISPGGDGGTGAAPGTLVVTDALLLAAGSETVIDIKPAGVDAIDATTGSIVLGGELRLRVNALYATSTSYNLFLGLDGNSGNFSSVTVRTGTDSASAINLVDDGSGNWTGSFAPQNLELAFDAGSGVLNVIAVPEPHTTALSLLGTTLLLMGRRRGTRFSPSN